MINVKSAEFMITLITFLLVYVVTVTLVGFFVAWVCQKMGDDTAAEQGLLSLNPAVHIDPVGLLGLMSIFFMGFGWGNHLPINPGNVHSSRHFNRWIKLFIAYMSDAFANCILSIIGMAALIIIFGQRVIMFAAQMMLGGQLSHMRFAAMFPEFSSLAVTCGLILTVFVYVNAFLAVFNIVFRGLELIMVYLLERSSDYAKYYNFFTIFIYAMVASIFLIPQLRLFLVLIILHVGYFIAYLFGGL
ncbi:MAG: hypothetical protein P4L31_02485 [Candidatus Babeliales bacterium]|nr:hypothetical protein [Candidatus Babeliales bacterium]